MGGKVSALNGETRTRTKFDEALMTQLDNAHPEQVKAENKNRR